MKVTSLNTQRKILQFDEFYPQENHLFYFLLSQFLFSIFWKKKNTKPGSFFTVTGPKTGNSARPTPLRGARPHPGRNVGLGRQSAAAARTRLGRETARPLSAVGSHPTVTQPSRPNKKARPATSAETLTPILLLPFSLSVARSPSESERERADDSASSSAPSPASVLPSG